MQIKTTVKYHITPGSQKITNKTKQHKNKKHNNAGKDARMWRNLNLYTVARNVKQCRHHLKWYGD